MDSINVVELTEVEMMSINGGSDSFYCWGGGFLLMLGAVAWNPQAIVVGIIFIADYC